MGVLEKLEPKNVFRYFEEISQVPRPSYHEEKISAYLVEFAKAHNLEYYQDDLYNVVMIKEASEGYENEEPIILQGHMDMVCEKTPDCKIDFENDPLELEINGDWISAKGTTLGGDDGVAVAFALAILDDDSLQHPRLEVVITVSEEVGMEGAQGVDLSMLKGHKLLNLDSEDEGVMLSSCAGGCSAEVTLAVERNEESGVLYTVDVDGLTGGHSGTEINKGRGNANLLLNRVISQAEEECALWLNTMEGGTKQNAIPRTAKASVLIRADDCKRFEAICASAAEEIKKEYATADPMLQICVTKEGKQSLKVLSKADTRRILGLLMSLPNGVQAMSLEIEGLVETSLNLGVLKLSDDALYLGYAPRSSVLSALHYLEKKIVRISAAFGAQAKISAEYPAWEYKKDSVIREDVIRVFEKMYGRNPVIEAIHAGVECGILAGKIEGLDGISMGPDIVDIHTTEERLSISSTARTYEFVCKVLALKH